MISRRTFLSVSALAFLGMSLPACLQSCGKAAALGASNAVDGSAPTTLTMFAFDTVITIEAYCSPEVLTQIEERLHFFEGIFSRTQIGSDVYAINHADGMPTQVQPETAQLIETALYYSQISDGLFDPTIGSVTHLWDFKNGIVPDEHVLAEALQHVDWRTVGVDGQTVTLTDPLAKLDLGGIAKGFIADDIVALLCRHNCTSALINLGGNTYAQGTKPDGSPWMVGLQDPNQERGRVYGQLRVKDRSVVASGTNERSFQQNNTYYHHLLDPRTGLPANNGTASVTIVSERSVDGDALSTIAFLMGAEKGLPYLEAQGVQAAYVLVDGTVISSEGLEVERA